MDMDREKLQSMLLPQLKELAKELGVKCSKCNKPVWIDRILAGLRGCRRRFACT